MQLSILTVFSCLVAWVAAGGLRNGYERVWLWYAYQIDLTLPEAERQIGKRCILWDFTNHECPPTYRKNRKGKPYGDPLPNYELCKGTLPDKSCYFWEFMGHIDKNTYKPLRNWLLPTTDTNDLSQQKALKPNPSATAQWLSMEHGSTVGEKSSNPIRAVTYPPFRIWAATGEIYNDMLKAVGEHSRATVAGLSADQRVKYKDQLDGLQLSLKSTIIEREIDHSAHVIQQANAEGFNLAKRTELGYTGDIVDWEETRALHTPEKFDKFFNDYYYLDVNVSPAPDTSAYKASKTAREHLQVMNDFRTIQNGIIACGL